jgi:DNA-binding NtrC family response regulator
MHATSTLLIVDDTPMTRHTLVRLLARTRPDTATALAADVADAYQLLGGGHITGVVTDYHLPDGTGLDVLHAVRRQDPHMPVIVMSGDTSVETAVLKAGANAFVAKPFDLTALANLLIGLS